MEYWLAGLLSSALVEDGLGFEAGGEAAVWLLCLLVNVLTIKSATPASAPLAGLFVSLLFLCPVAVVADGEAALSDEGVCVSLATEMEPTGCEAAALEPLFPSPKMFMAVELTLAIMLATGTEAAAIPWLPPVGCGV